MMGIFVETPGLLTTIQDLGRGGSRSLGLNPSGAMDRNALRLINILLGNDESEAALEFHFPAPTIRFEADAYFVLGGAEFDARLDGDPVPNWFCHRAFSGQMLHFAKPVIGARAYLAVAGGFDIDPVLGSRSTNLAAGFGGFQGRALQPGDRIGIRENVDSRQYPKGFVSSSLIPRHSRFPTVRFMAGPEFRLITAKSEQELFTRGFVIAADSNRMGFRLKGATIHLLHHYELPSSPVDLGTVQLLPDGGLIVLMADHQTTGGYPRLGSVIQVDMPLLAQLAAGDGVGFHFVSSNEAEQLLFASEREIDLFRVGRRLAAI